MHHFSFAQRLQIRGRRNLAYSMLVRRKSIASITSGFMRERRSDTNNFIAEKRRSTLTWVTGNLGRKCLAAFPYCHGIGLNDRPHVGPLHPPQHFERLGIHCVQRGHFLEWPLQRENYLPKIQYISHTVYHNVTGMWKFPAVNDLRQWCSDRMKLSICMGEEDWQDVRG